MVLLAYIGLLLQVDIRLLFIVCGRVDELRKVYMHACTSESFARLQVKHACTMHVSCMYPLVAKHSAVELHGEALDTCS